MRRWRALDGQRLRQVAKVVLATLLAYALTLGKRNEFALYSALGAALVVGGSLSDDLKASLNRVRGTLAGTAVGIALAYLLGTSIWSLCLGTAVVAWLSIGLDWGAPAMRIGLAMVLVVLAAHSTDPAHYALWRAFNTLIGVGVGLAVGRFLWPIRARDLLSSALDRSLAATAAALEGLASGASREAMTPRLAEVHDAVAAIRAARQDASLESRVHGDHELPVSQARLASRAAIATLAANVTHEELVRTGGRADSVREALEALAAEARDATGSPEHGAEFTARHERALQAAARPELDDRARRSLMALLNDLEQIHALISALHEARRGSPAR